MTLRSIPARRPAYFDFDPAGRIDNVGPMEFVLVNDFSGKERTHEANEQVGWIPLFEVEPHSPDALAANADRSWLLALALRQGGAAARQAHVRLRLGQCLSRCRRAAGLRLTRLAQHAGLDDNAVAQLEWGLASLQEYGDRLPAYARGCGVPWRHLVAAMLTMVCQDEAAADDETPAQDASVAHDVRRFLEALPDPSAGP